MRLNRLSEIYILRRLMYSLLFVIGTILLRGYLFILLLRMVLDWVTVLSRHWQPRGILLVVANVVYSLTDPPLNLTRKFIPPLRLGNVSLDVGFMLVFFAVILLQRLWVLLGAVVMGI